MQNENNTAKEGIVEIPSKALEYIIQPADIGKTVKSLNIEKTNKVSDSSEALLNDLLFSGVCTKTYGIGIGSGFKVVFRTVNGETVQVGWLIVKEKTDGADNNMQATMRNYMKFMGIARYLKSYGDNDFSHSENGDKVDFESKEEVERRFNFVCSLPAMIIDKLGEIQSTFIDEISLLMKIEVIENF